MSTHRRYESSVGRVLYDSDDGCFFDYRESGSYGTIYGVGGMRALKVFKSELGERQAIECRDAEVRILQKLNGADGHVPVCHSVGVCFEKKDDNPYSRELLAYEMDLVPGVTLEYAIEHKVLTGGASLLDGKRALEVMEKVCEAVAACHSPSDGEGSVHRDLAPKNIMIETSGESVSNAAIVDWGQAPRDNPYYTPAMKGTPAYAAPELLRARATERDGQNKVLEFELPTVDVWSLGAIAYFVRTGVHPSLSDDPNDQIEKSLAEYADYREKHPISLSDCNNNYDEYLNEFIRRCTENNPKHRFQNAGKAREYLDEKKRLNQSKVVPTQTPHQRAVPKDTPVPTTKPSTTDAPIITSKSASTDVWAAQYKLYRGDKLYSGQRSDLLVVGSSQESCVITTYRYNKRTYTARRVGDVLNVNDEGGRPSKKVKKSIWRTVEVVEFVDDVKPTSLRGWFAGCRRLKKIRNIDRLDTSAVQDFAGMFYYCESLKSLNLSNFKTSNASDMRFMFYNCRSLISLNLSSFDTSRVTNMGFMFYECSSLTSLNLSFFNTSNVTDMRGMFYYCESLKSLNLSNFKTSNVINMKRMFYNCRSLISLNLSSFDTSRVTNMSGMFGECRSLKSLNLSNFKTSNASNMRFMFYNCRSLTDLNLAEFDTSSVTDMRGMFANCESLNSLNLSNFKTSNVMNMSSMFYNCRSLISLNLSSFDTSRVTNMGFMFYECSSLTSLNLSFFNTSNVTDMSFMFFMCVSLRSLDISGFNAPQVEDLAHMFEACVKLRRIKGKSFPHPKEARTAGMYKNCRSLGWRAAMAIGYKIADVSASSVNTRYEVMGALVGPFSCCTLLSSVIICLSLWNILPVPAFVIVGCIVVPVAFVLVLIFSLILDGIGSRFGLRRRRF